MKSDWKKYLLYGSIIIFVGLFIFLTYETYKANNMGFETKTYWDWMELLLIPLFLAGGVYYLDQSERKTERDIAKDRQQEQALQSYIDKMSELLLLKRELLTTDKGEVRDVARTRTIAILRGLDKERNDLVIQFLRETKLIKGKSSILNSADMEGINLQELNLSKIYMQNTNLREANLQDATLIWANLGGADLSEADLRGVDLRSAQLSGTNLGGAELRRARMNGASLNVAILKGADLRAANFSRVDLSGADLNEANLSGVNFTRANLSGADVSNEQLASAKSLEGATMPDGTKHD